ncbi:MAG: hypothetical protein GX997_08945 [Bacteroidales bacterium]|nr:hypothetical protein [Bacteroidales bacterium]
MTATALIYRMIINAIAGESELNEQLYETYVKEQRLHASIAEMLQAKKESA